MTPNHRLWKSKSIQESKPVKVGVRGIRTSQTLLGILGAFCIFYFATGAQATSNIELTQENIQEILLNKGWQASYAREFSQIKIEYKDLKSISAMAVTYERTPWYTSLVYIDPVIAQGQVPEAIEHELHHLADWRITRSYRTDEISRDFFLLGTSYRSVEVYSRLPVEYYAIIHYNHDLIASLGWNYTLLPDWYKAKHFYYADPNFVGYRQQATATPTPTPTPGTQGVYSTPTPASYKIYVTQVRKNAA